MVCSICLLFAFIYCDIYVNKFVVGIVIMENII